jgi:hypothetical protein
MDPFDRAYVSYSMIIDWLWGNGNFKGFMVFLFLSANLELPPNLDLIFS